MALVKGAFEVIARVIAEELPRAFDERHFAMSETTYREHVAREFAEALKDTNPRFNFRRFMLACGVDPEAEVMDPEAEYIMGLWVNRKEVS